MAPVTEYDAAIIGAGQAGVPLARALAAAGWQTALIEREHVGGTCYNEGCTPTKTMIASARMAYLARRAADYGVVTGPVAIDMAAVRQRKRDLVESWRTGSERRLRDTANLDLLPAEASFVAPHRLEVRPTEGESLPRRREIHLPEHGGPPSDPHVARYRPGPVLHLHHGDGVGRRSRAPGHSRRRLRRGGVQSDVPAFREPCHHRAEARDPSSPRGSGYGRGNRGPSSVKTASN